MRQFARAGQLPLTLLLSEREYNNLQPRLTVACQPAMDQTITDPTKAELDWVVAQRQAASRFVASASPNDAGQPLTLAALDRAFKAWTPPIPKM